MINTLSYTSRIDALRAKVTQEIIDNTQRSVDEVTSISSREELEPVLRKYFPYHQDQPLRNFFMSHPVQWSDLIRKLSKHRKNDGEQGWHIDEEGIGDIYSTFLVLGRPADTGPKLRARLPERISKNQELLAYASRQPSLLDSGGYRFSKIPGERKKSIAKLVRNGFIQNIEGCKFGNLDEYFKDIFPLILEYIHAIFGIRIELGYCTTGDQLIREIEKMMSSPSGERREHGYLVMQAIYAWSGIQYIQDLSRKAQQEVAKLPKIISQAMGVKLGSIETETRNGAVVYSTKFMLGKREYTLSWRVKTLKSILHKQWESEEYTNIDAMRDIIGISLVYPDDCSEDEVIDITVRLCTLMPDFGYILKDKGNLGSRITEVGNKATERKKSPVYISTKRGGSTKDDFRNTSISGFMRFGKTPLGTEFQIMNQSSSEWKKMDDKVYKPRGAIEALIRGKKFCTPKECLALLNARIPASDFSYFKAENLSGILMGMIAEGYLLPYESGGLILLTTKEKEKKFQSEFPHMKKVSPEDTLQIGQIRTYCETLNSNI